MVRRLDEQCLADAVENAPEGVQAAAQLLGIAQVLDDQRGQPGALGDQAEVLLDAAWLASGNRR